MQKVMASVSLSLDGYSAGPNWSVKHPLGEGGERLHAWKFPPQGHDPELMEFTPEGAVIIGKHMYTSGEAPWGENPPFHLPVFVLTHEPRETLVKEGGTTFTFVTDGIESALSQAKAAAGDKDVAVGGGANAIQQYLKAGLLDELLVHVVPVIFGSGIRFFEETGSKHIELERVKVIVSPSVTHFWFRIPR